MIFDTILTTHIIINDLLHVFIHFDYLLGGKPTGQESMTHEESQDAVLQPEPPQASIAGTSRSQSRGGSYTSLNLEGKMV